MVILALDLGERRIGVAVSDDRERLALPLATIERTSLRDDLERIVSLAREYGAGAIVVGDPRSLRGERGAMSRRADEFCDRLRRAFDGFVEQMDERLTTAQANRSLLEADLSRAKRKATVDKLAATLILESYLSRRRRESEPG